ncbi:MAG: hypothetical protein OSA97_05615 [Nevskia sp.]|nr:hypothetical protein [Nevskia sp.]
MAVKYKVNVAGKERGDALSIRINTKLKFTLELWARLEHKNISTVVSEALQGAVKERANKPVALKGGSRPWAELIEEVWNPLESDRLVKLATLVPEALSDHEQVVWNLIKENSQCFNRGQPDLSAIRKAWDQFNAEAKSLLDKQG